MLAELPASPGPATAAGPARRASLLSPGARYILLRLCFVPIGALAVATLSFFFVNLIPSDPVRAFLGSLATKAQIVAEQHKLGLDQSVWDRYIRYMSGLFHGSLGNSYYGGQAVIDAIGQRIVSSAELIIPAFILAYLIGVTLGGIGAYFKGRPADRVAGAAVALAQSIPDYIVGLLGVFILFYELHLLPAPTGQLSLIIIPPQSVTNASFIDSLIAGNGPAITDSLQHLIMPVLALASPTRSCSRGSPGSRWSSRWRPRTSSSPGPAACANGKWCDRRSRFPVSPSSPIRPRSSRALSAATPLSSRSSTGRESASGR